MSRHEVVIALGGFATGIFLKKVCNKGQLVNWLFFTAFLAITVFFTIISIKHEKKKEEEIEDLKRNLTVANTIICDLAAEEEKDKA